MIDGEAREVLANGRRGDVRALEHLTRDRDLFQGRVGMDHCDLTEAMLHEVAEGWKGGKGAVTRTE